MVKNQRRIAIAFRVGTLHEGLQCFSPSPIAMDVGVFANSRWWLIYLGHGRRPTVVCPNFEEVLEHLVFSMSSPVTDLFDARLSECF